MAESAIGTPSDEESAWRRFGTAITAVLGVSIAGVIAIAGLFNALSVSSLLRAEQRTKAAELSHFMARTLFVPVSLGDTATMRRAVEAYLDDPDLASVEVRGADGETLLTQSGRAGRDGGVIDAKADIVAPEEAAGARGAEVFGSVTVSLGTGRIDKSLRRTSYSIALASLLLLLLAAGADLVLIWRMTRRIQGVLAQAGLARELQRSNEELEHFAYIASHDLQAPLRRMVGFAELVQRRLKGTAGAEIEGYLDTIAEGGARMRSLVQDLLAFSRVSKQTAPLAPVDLDVVVQDVLRTLQEPVAEARAEVKVAGLPAVMGDAAQLRQLFQNLIANAVKFRGERPAAVSISAARQGAWWEFSVRDNGIGFEKEHAEGIFQMFTRLHSQDAYPGTGIGLAICKRVVERHGGRIWAESEPGKGSTFRFTLHAVTKA